MSHFAKVNKTNKIVEDVIVATPAFIATLPEEHNYDWIQTSYNTFGGIHTQGGIPLRKNYAVKGFMYDIGRDAFIPPKLYDSWVLDEDTCLWKAPIEKPEGNCKWNEESQEWQQLPNSGTF